MGVADFDEAEGGQDEPEIEEEEVGQDSGEEPVLVVPTNKAALLPYSSRRHPPYSIVRGEDLRGQVHHQGEGIQDRDRQWELCQLSNKEVGGASSTGDHTTSNPLLTWLDPEGNYMKGSGQYPLHATPFYGQI